MIDLVDEKPPDRKVVLMKNQKIVRDNYTVEVEASELYVDNKSRKRSGFAADMNADPRRSGERIALNVVDGECVARKLIGATGGFIGGIAFVIDTE